MKWRLTILERLFQPNYHNKVKILINNNLRISLEISKNILNKITIKLHKISRNIKTPHSFMVETISKSLISITKGMKIKVLHHLNKIKIKMMIT